MNGLCADIIFHVKKELQKKYLSVKMKKRLKSYSLIRGACKFNAPGKWIIMQSKSDYHRQEAN